MAASRAACRCRPARTRWPCPATMTRPVPHRRAAAPEPRPRRLRRSCIVENIRFDGSGPARCRASGGCRRQRDAGCIDRRGPAGTAPGSKAPSATPRPDVENRTLPESAAAHPCGNRRPAHCPAARRRATAKPSDAKTRAGQFAPSAEPDDGAAAVPSTKLPSGHPRLG